MHINHLLFFTTLLASFFYSLVAGANNKLHGNYRAWQARGLEIIRP